MVKVPAWARGFALASHETPPYMRTVDGPALIAGSEGLSLVGAGTKAAGDELLGGRKAKKESLPRLRGAAAASQARAERAGAAHGPGAAAHLPIPGAHGTGAPHAQLTTAEALTRLRALHALNATLPARGQAGMPNDDDDDDDDDDDEEGSSMSTLRWQMYVGWLAILTLCSVMVGRRVCRKAKHKGVAPGPGAKREV